MRRRLPITLAFIAAIAAGAGLLVPKAFAAHRDHATWVNPPAAVAGVAPATATPQSETMTVANVSVDFTGEFFGWAMLDRRTGAVAGENLGETSSTESMIKTWVVADFLRRSGVEKGTTPTAEELDLAREAIRWSDDDATQTLYVMNGEDASIERMIQMCGLTETTVYSGWWSRTQMSPRDAVRLGDCIVNTTAAGPNWTDWLLQEMRKVEGTTAASDQESTRGGGRWGIIDGVPAGQAGSVAIKNGWTARSDGNWHLNCLAVTEDWTMSVMMRYPSGQGLDYGAGVCESVARQLLS